MASQGFSHPSMQLGVLETSGTHTPLLGQQKGSVKGSGATAVSNKRDNVSPALGSKLE